MSNWPQTCNYCGAPLQGARCPRCNYERQPFGEIVYSGFSDGGGVMAPVGGIQRIARGEFVSYDADDSFSAWTWPGVQCAAGSTLLVAICAERPGAGLDVRIDATVNGVTTSQIQFDEISESVGVFRFNNVAAGPHDITFSADALHNYYAGFVTEVRGVVQGVAPSQNHGGPTTAPGSVASISNDFTLAPAGATHSFVMVALHTEGPISDTHGAWGNAAQGQSTGHPAGGNSYITEGWAIAPGSGLYTVTNGPFTSRIANYVFDVNLAGLP